VHSFVLRVGRNRPRHGRTAEQPGELAPSHGPAETSGCEATTFGLVHRSKRRADCTLLDELVGSYKEGLGYG
jgi:hypothetical protein